MKLGLIDAPALRRLLMDLDQKQINLQSRRRVLLLLEYGLPLHLRGTPWQSLKLFSSDTALANEFVNTLFCLHR